MKVWTVGKMDHRTGKFVVRTERWIKDKGQLMEPCDSCREFIGKGEWYFRDGNGPMVWCKRCAVRIFDAVCPEADPQCQTGAPGTLECLHDPCTWPPKDCPFAGCVRR